MKEKTTKKTGDQIYGYYTTYSPDEGGWYITVCNRAGEDVWSTELYSQKVDAINALKGSKYFKERLVYIGV